jgi:diaminohydroxyphosphoribosylaminopyrimidine deaminase / 5-amino-6-(5-phosphoribosylamino)uracil reductase
VSIEDAPSVLASAREETWDLVLAAAALASSLECDDRNQTFVFEHGRLAALPPDATDAVLAWRPGEGWQSQVSPADPRADLLDLYLPLCSATTRHPIAVGHLGQSLDGFIATQSGDSQFVTGHANVVHMHWLRGLCDAIIVGAGTVAADDPQLTTRHVPGPHPLRVIFDPSRRLSPQFKVFSDAVAPTLYVCRDEHVAKGETHIGIAPILGVSGSAPGGAPAALLRLLRERGCARVFVEGGGVTVSAFLEAGLLDRLHLAVAPVIIGSGRPAIRLRPATQLRDCLRPACRVFRMGGDVLFDCDLRSTAEPEPSSPRIARVL